MSTVIEPDSWDRSWSDTGYRADPNHVWVKEALRIACPLQACRAAKSKPCRTGDGGIVHYARIAEARVEF